MDVKENIDIIVYKAKDVAAAAARKTRQLAQIGKANIAIYSLEEKIKKAERELGKLYYRDYAVDEERDIAEYLPWCKKIDEAKRSIADLRDYIEDLKMEESTGVEDEIILDAELPDIDEEVVEE